MIINMKRLFTILIFSLPVLCWGQVNPSYMNSFLRNYATAKSLGDSAFKLIILQLNTAIDVAAKNARKADSLQTVVNRKQDSLKLLSDKLNTVKDKSQDSVIASQAKVIVAIQKRQKADSVLISSIKTIALNAAAAAAKYSLLTGVPDMITLKATTPNNYSIDIAPKLKARITALEAKPFSTGAATKKVTTDY